MGVARCALLHLQLKLSYTAGKSAFILPKKKLYSLRIESPFRAGRTGPADQAFAGPAFALVKFIHNSDVIILCNTQYTPTTTTLCKQLLQYVK